MKTLYFVGNEELWKAPWFQKILETLRAQEGLHVVLFDFPADAEKIKELPAKLGLDSKAVLHSEFKFKELFDLEENQVSAELVSSLAVFVEKTGTSKILQEISLKVTPEIFLAEIKLGEISKIHIEDFLMEMEAPVEGIKKDIVEISQIDADILLADAEEISALMVDPSIEKTAIKTTPPEEEGTKIDSTRASLTLGSRARFNENSESIPIVIHELDGSEKEKAIEEADSIISISESVADDVGKDFSKDMHDEKSAREVKHLLSAMSQEIPNEDVEVLKRYSSIKERELRESQASQEALRQQMKLQDDKLKRSEDERRRLMLKFEEVENELHATNDKRDENKAQLRNVESHYDDKVKELQIQLESSQFQASKLDKKLEEFRERVRTDLQKIRSRERELSSRLEIQKRDAEALLSAKDERLLAQKREMDRLEFELDALREKLLDEAQKGEERRKRVARALQSLKLAQSILSGLEEEGVFAKDEKAA